jgi:excisionase family DNA binding protein
MRSPGRLGCHHVRMVDLPRFLTLADVAELLNTSVAQVYAMVRRGELDAIKIGGRGQWRVSEADLEGYIAQLRVATREFIDSHPFDSVDETEDEDVPR